MAYNVFGNPITDATLQAMPEFVGKTITRLDRARVALNMKNAQDKDKNARAYVENLKQQWGVGVSTLCLIYNATGDTIRFIGQHSWYGRIGPGSYPIKIANGQWGAFLHVKRSVVASGSVGAVVYRGLNNKNQSCDWMAAWSNPWNRARFDNKAYTDINVKGYFTENNRWNEISEKLYGGGLFRSYRWNGCQSDVMTGTGTTTTFEAIFTLKED